MDDDILLPTTPRFYGTYLDIANDETPPDIDPETLLLLKDRGFSKFVIEHEDPTVAVKMLAYTVSHSLLKPQRVLVDEEDYYIAIDLFTNTYYMCCRNLLMVDVDRYKQDATGADTLEDLLTKLSRHPELFFRIYATRNGYHVFVLNRKMDYKSDASIRLAHELGSDFYYMVYSYLRGWSVRLNKKKGEEDRDVLYTWVGDVVCGQFFAADFGSRAEIPEDIPEASPTDIPEASPTDTPEASPTNIPEPSPTDIPEISPIDILEVSPIDIPEASPTDYPIKFEDIVPDPRLDYLVGLHIELVDVFAEVGLCSMPAP